MKARYLGRGWPVQLDFLRLYQPVRRRHRTDLQAISYLSSNNPWDRTGCLTAYSFVG
jgi:hypothetical protein